MSDSVRPHRRQPTRLPHPWDSPGKHWSGLPFPSPNAWKWKVNVKSFSPVRLLATPWTAAHQAPPSMGFSRQEYWSGVPLPSPQNSHAAAAKSLQSCPTLCDPTDGSPQGSCPWDSPGKNTGVGCHFLLQCMKVKSESEVAQLCPTLRNPMDCSLPSSFIHGIFQARVLEWGAVAFSAKFTYWCPNTGILYYSYFTYWYPNTGILCYSSNICSSKSIILSDLQYLWSTGNIFDE